jgi:hypothetical protein
MQYRQNRLVQGIDKKNHNFKYDFERNVPVLTKQTHRSLYGADIAIPSHLLQQDAIIIFVHNVMPRNHHKP